jgi:hypothetical protein
MVWRNFGLEFHIPKQDKNVDINTCLETFNFLVIAERVLKMSSVRFSICLNTSHHGPPHLFRDARVVADSPTGIHNVMVKCLFIVNRGCIHKCF